MAAKSKWPGMFRAFADAGILRATGTRHGSSLICVHGQPLNVCQLCHIRRTRGKEKGSGQPAMNRSRQGRMTRKSIIGVWLIALALVPFRITHAQQSAKVSKIGSGLVPLPV